MIIMKKIKIIGVFVIIPLSILCHFLYEWNSNFIFSVLCPINESIWEHMKLMATPFLLYGIFEWIYYKKKNINYDNLLISLCISIIVGIIAYLVPYLIIDKFISHNMILSISLLFLDYCFMEYLSFKIINTNKIKYSNYIGIILLFLIYFMFYYLTYNPPHTYLFYDTKDKSYGIKN